MAAFNSAFANKVAESRGELGLIKLSVVLKLGVVVSELDDASSTLNLRFSPVHSPPNLYISLLVIRELVSPEKRKLPSDPSASSGITPCVAACILPRFTPSKDPKLTVSKPVGAAKSLRPLIPDA